MSDNPPVVECIDGFLLSRQWRDTRDGIDLSFWAHTARGPLRISVPGQHAVCFVDRDCTLNLPSLAQRKQVQLRTPAEKPVDAVYTSQQRQMVELHKQFAASGQVHESDIKPAERYLSERFINAGFSVSGVVQQRAGYIELVNPKWRAANPALNLVLASIDIETRGLSGELYSIGIHCGKQAIVLMIDANARQDSQSDRELDFTLRYCCDEAALLHDFFTILHDLDPDVLIGWNLVSFDLDFLARKCGALGIVFALGRGGEVSAILQPSQVANLSIARVPGRAILDGIDLLRAAFWSFESFALNHVANQLIGRGKIISKDNRLDEINYLFEHDKVALAQYNIEDCKLVSEIFEHASLIDFAVQRARMTGLPIDKTGGSVQTFDNLYLPRMHRLGYVAPFSTDRDGLGSPGGYVLDSIPGLYRNVIVLDFKSLYPSIIRSFLIDPLGMAVDSEDPVPGFAGASFSRDIHILPGLIAELWRQRDRAKLDSNAALSQAIKIIMNSFYGVLGSNGCRFHDHRLASSITRRGHQIIQTSRGLIEDEKLQVIYGDTDSLFVLLSEALSAKQVQECGLMLQAKLNRYWRETLSQSFRLESCLEVEFETHFQRFFMPTVRGSESGSKKRYAGYIAGKNGVMELLIKGLEAARTDWTPLAREFQRTLFERVFQDQPVEALVRDIRERLLSGSLDEKLVYRKRIRRQLADYQRNVPPHIQAARKLPDPGRWIEYVITRSGPEPVQALMAEPDYEHYLNRQLAPAADGILHCLNTSFEAICGAQMRLF